MSKFSIPLLTIGGTPAGLAAADAWGAVGAAAVPGFSITLGHVLGGAGLLLSAGQSRQSGIAAQQQANLQAEIFRRESVRERQVSEREASEFGRRTRALLATQRARQGGSGVQVGVGKIGRASCRERV